MGFTTNSTFGFSGNNNGGGGGGVTNANNGLSLFDGNTVQLGGPVTLPSPLLNDRYIETTPDFSLNIHGDVPFQPGNTHGTLNLSNDGIGNALYVNTTAAGSYGISVITAGSYGILSRNSSMTGIGVRGDAAGENGAGVIGFASGEFGYGGEFLVSTGAVTNTVKSAVEISHVTTAPGTDGIGVRVDFSNNVSDNSGQTSTAMISKWVNATRATRVSQFIMTGTDNAVDADLFTMNGDGSFQFNKYGSGIFSGSPAYFLAVDASGNIIETASGGGGISSADNGLSLFSGTTAQLGGPIGAPSQLLDDRYIDAGTFGFGLTIDGDAVNSVTGSSISITGAGKGIEIIAGSLGISSTSPNFPGWFISTSATPNSPQTALLVEHQMLSGTPAVGTGVQIVFDAQNETLAGDNVAYMRAYMSSVTAGSETSRIDFLVTTNGFSNFVTPLTLLETGQIRFDEYGSGTFTGSPAFFLAVDSSGNIIEASGGGGGISGAVNGLSVDSGNAVWGGDQFDPSASAAALLSSREIPFGSNTMFFSNGQDSSLNDMGIFIAASEISIGSNGTESQTPIFNIIEFSTGISATWSIQNDGIVRFNNGSSGLDIYPSNNMSIGDTTSGSDNAIATIQLRGNVTISTVNGVGISPMTVILYDTVSTELAQGGVNNGLSIDSNGNLVLGNSIGDSEAALVTGREIPMNNLIIRLSNGVDTGAHVIRTDIDGSSIVINTNAAEIESPTFGLGDYSTGSNGSFTIDTNGTVLLQMTVPTISGLAIYQSSNIQLGILAGFTADNGAAIQCLGNVSMPVVTDNHASLPLGNGAVFYAYTGTVATAWTLPSSPGAGWFYFIKNRGSANITLGGTSNIYTTSSVATLTITPGQSYYVWYDGSLWNAE